MPRNWEPLSVHTVGKVRAVVTVSPGPRPRYSLAIGDALDGDEAAAKRFVAVRDVDTVATSLTRVLTDALQAIHDHQADHTAKVQPARVDKPRYDKPGMGLGRFTKDKPETPEAKAQREARRAEKRARDRDERAKMKGKGR